MFKQSKLLYCTIEDYQLIGKIFLQVSRPITINTYRDEET